MFMVTPRSPRTRKESSIDVGMATPTKTEVRTPRKNRSTPTISSRPERMLFSRLLTIMRMSRDMSEVVLTTVVGGSSASIPAMTA